MTERPLILSIAFPFAPIGPGAVGGAEVILSELEAALPSLGFGSVVVAHAESRPGGQLYPVAVPAGEITDAVRSTVEEAQQAQLDRALTENPVALVHMHGLDFHAYRLPPSVPVLVTLHLPPAWYPETIWTLPPHYHFVCVSASQRRACPPAAQHRITVIDNGVPLPPADSLRPTGRYALMLARICAEKNLAAGLDAARLAGLPAMLGGEVFPYPDHVRYFAEEIEPRLTRTGAGHTGRYTGRDTGTPAEARFLGPVTGPAKARLLARAACLLIPSLAPETSSLVAMEAAAAGIPVIAMASGALPEIVEDGRTGFLVPPGAGEGTTEAMAAAIGRLPTLDRRICREVAEARFALPRMLADYAQLYRTLARNVPPDSRATQASGELGAPLRNSNSGSQDFQQSSPLLNAETFPVPRISSNVLTDAAALDALLPSWSTLWAEDPHATPFQHPAWLRPWWRQFGPDGLLHTLALRDSDTERLLGLLPTYLYRQPETGSQLLLLLGAGTTDYLDGLWSPALPGAAASTLQALLGEPPPWDAAYLAQLRPDSPLRLAAKRAHLPLASAEPTAVLDVAAPLPARLRANIGRYRRRAAATGTLTCTVASDAASALDSFETLLRFHSDRWGARGEPGVLADPRVQAHHREAIPQLQVAGLLRFFRLTVDDVVLGVLYALADPPARSQRTLYLYLIGFEAAAANLSPGTLLLHEAWEYARNEGFAALDLLRGGEEYKQLWGAQQRPTFALDLKRSR